MLQTIAVVRGPVTRTSGDAVYTFSSWSDASPDHTITVRVTPATYTASFVRCAVPRTGPPDAVATASATNRDDPRSRFSSGGGGGEGGGRSRRASPTGTHSPIPWDLDSNGAFGDSTAVAPTFTLNEAVSRHASDWRVNTDSKGAFVRPANPRDPSRRRTSAAHEPAACGSGSARRGLRQDQKAKESCRAHARVREGRPPLRTTRTSGVGARASRRYD
jgi:hypothetical protein